MHKLLNFSSMNRSQIIKATEAPALVLITNIAGNLRHMNVKVSAHIAGRVGLNLTVTSAMFPSLQLHLTGKT